MIGTKIQEAQQSDLYQKAEEKKQTRMCTLKITAFLTIVLFCVAFGEISYECQPAERLRVDIIVDAQKSGLKNGLLLQKNAKNICESQSNDTNFFSLKNCTADTAVELEWIEYKGDMVAYKTVFFSLQCKWNEKHIVLSKNASLTEKFKNGQPTKQKDVDWTIPTLTMDVTPSTGIIGQDASITISSKDIEHSFLVEECYATSGDKKHNHTLYENCKSSDTDLFVEKAWTKNISSTPSPFFSWKHPMKYFRFRDTFEVQLYCKVRICPIGKNSQCSPCTTRRRRRRSVDGESTLVRATFKVLDENVKRFSVVNSTPGLTTNGILSIVMSACTGIVIGLQRLTLN